MLKVPSNNSDSSRNSETRQSGLQGGGGSWNILGGNNSSKKDVRESRREQKARSASRLRRASLAKQIPGKFDILDSNEKPGHVSGTANADGKLGTFSGVFVPTTLNVLSILMFLRFGFILGQGGVLGMMGMLLSSYLINLVTTMSISAIATNGTVRGGGAYYLISRSLGAEFGGSIGIVFYLGCVLNTGLNAVGLIDCLTENFGTSSGVWSNFLGEGFWWQYLWATIVLILCTLICLAGSSVFARASNGLLAILLVATFSIPLSALIRGPFTNPRFGLDFTGFSRETFLGNLKPNLTKGAAGSQLVGKETFQDLFGVLFPATGGIFAGASMSGDLKDPSKSIPKGTLCGLCLTFFTYTIVILAIASSVTRESLYNDVNVIQDTNLSGALILLGEFATSFFSALMGVVGASNLLQAISRDTLLPGLSVFCPGTGKRNGSLNAIIFTFVIAQLTTLFNINRIASFISMAYLMTFLVTNLACFLLEIGSAPNFRPSFHYFNSWTALAGTLISGASMFFVDGIYASACVCVLILLFLLIHYMAPPKPWGDVSQSLIYHQVRKYLLRLRPEHVKFWRPQILLFVDNSDSQYKMIHFCNSLKKGALFVLGRVIVTEDFAGALPEFRREQTSWAKFIEFSKVKAFMNITLAPNAEWGIRNIVLNSGLGGMRPNIVVIDQFRKAGPDSEGLHRTVSRRDSKPINRLFTVSEGTTDDATQPKAQSMVNIQSYLAILEDLLFNLRINVAVARGFENLELPGSSARSAKKYIDLWPIQMSAEVSADGSHNKQKFLTTNFDTYTLILQLGCILHTVKSWKGSYMLRVIVFVEYETDVEDERARVITLLEKLRIEAEVLVFWLASGDLQTYRVVVNGEEQNLEEATADRVEEVLKDEDWWQELSKFRSADQQPRTKGKSQRGANIFKTPVWSNSSSQNEPVRDRGKGYNGLKKIAEASKRRMSVGSMSVNIGMQTHRFLDSVVQYTSDSSDEETSSEESDIEPYISESDGELDTTGAQPPAEPGRTDPFPNFYESSGQPSHPTGKNLAKRRGEATRRSRSSLEIPTTRDDSTASGVETLQPSSTTPTIVQPSQDSSTPEEPRRPSRPLLQARTISSTKVASGAKFSSAPIPVTKVADEEGAGPSIMFASSSPPSRSTDSSTPRESIYNRRTASTPDMDTARKDSQASGYPIQASVPLSFNDVPCRAQYLILNELIKSQSERTAVVFTTLPSPVEGVWRDETASESYVSDLEVLCDSLPPCLLVHSNSVTVTMNL